MPFMIWREITWTSGQAIMGLNSTACYVRAIVASPQLYANWGTLSAANSGAGAVNSAANMMRLELGNTTGDLFRIGSTQLTGSVNLGNTDAAVGLGIGAYAAGTSPSDIEVAEVWGVQGGTLSAQEISDLVAYAQTEYGNTLLV